MLKFVTFSSSRSRGKIVLIIQQEYLSGTQVCIIEANRRDNDTKIKNHNE